MPAKTVTRSNRIERAFKSAQAAKGFTQADVAKRLKVDQTTVSKWYRHADDMSVGKLRLLCQVLAISPQDILSIE